jgi:CTP synthase
MCDVELPGVVAAVDAPSIYDIPKVLNSEGLDSYVIKRLGIQTTNVEWGDWEDLLQKVHNPKYEVNVALVGKYIDLPDAYLSVTEALRAGGFANYAKVNIKWVTSDSCVDEAGASANLSGIDAICVPGGFGVRGIEGKLGALKFARENRIPTLGLCLGLQCMVIEASRNLAGLKDANSAEFDEQSKHHVISTMSEQLEIVAGNGQMGATMRLGLYKADLQPGSLVASLYGRSQVSERHRHRYEVNNKYRDQIQSTGMIFSGLSPDKELVEFVELPKSIHPYYVGTQAHPEFLSRPTKPHPLFIGLIAAAIEKHGK